MIRFCTVLIVLLATPLSADYFHMPARGWHWNNVIVKRAAKKPKLKSAPVISAPEMEAAQFQAALKAAKAAWVANPSFENDERLMVLQKIAEDKASFATKSMLQFIALNPRFNAGLTYPTNNAAQTAMLNAKAMRQKAFAAAVAKHFGLFYFYQGHKPEDIVNAKMVSLFAHLYGFSLIGIPVDGVATNAVADNKVDNGQAKRLGVKATPAIMLVNPHTRQVIPLYYGYVSTTGLLTALSERLGVSDE